MAEENPDILEDADIGDADIGDADIGDADIGDKIIQAEVIRDDVAIEIESQLEAAEDNTAG
ncbi:MAG: hypothetical protein P1S60_06225, partial [Anaerolineae bacterium]|nr:hypothetical protein [Anaerolineae bacterium]